jgi:hypothetical protein
MAASGQVLPVLDVLLADAGARGADTGAWQRRREQPAAARHDSASGPGGGPSGGHVSPFLADHAGGSYAQVS